MSRSLPTRAAAGAAASAFGALARARHDRALHPEGELWHATAVLEAGPPGVPALAAPREVQALLRVSRAVGLPGPLPDVLGVAVRLCDLHGPGRHQDLLLASSPPPPLHLVLAPAREGHTWFTGLLPYRVGDERGVLAARRTGELRYDLLLTHPAGRRAAHRLGHVAGGPQRAEGDVRFDPVRHAAPQLCQAAGFLNTVRARSYAASRAGSRAASPG